MARELIRRFVFDPLRDETLPGPVSDFGSLLLRARTTRAPRLLEERWR